VTVICAADVTASLRVAVMFIVEAALYEPLVVVDEKLVRVGRITSAMPPILPKLAEPPLDPAPAILTARNSNVCGPTTTPLKSIENTTSWIFPTAGLTAVHDPESILYS
jgi:hypothetical protein